MRIGDLRPFGLSEFMAIGEHHFDFDQFLQPDLCDREFSWSPPSQIMIIPIRSANAPEPPDEEVTQEEQIISHERNRETEWRRLAADLKERNFLDVNADISELLAECRRAFADENIAYELVRGMEHIGTPISALLLSGVVLAREAADHGITEQRLPALSEPLYPRTDDMPKELIQDIHEHADWIADVMENPTRAKRQSKTGKRVDEITLNAIQAVLNELSVRFYCLSQGWTPRIARDYKL
jgi:hypothetical protein